MKNIPTPIDYPENIIETELSMVEEPLASYGSSHLNTYDRACISRQGLPISSLRTLANRLHLTNNDLADIFEMSEKTLRNRIKRDDKLKSYESDLALAMSSLVREGWATFESEDTFNQWLHSSWEAMGYQKPIEFLRSISGIHFLIDELKSIRHGIFA